MIRPDPALVSTDLTVRQYFVSIALQGLLSNSALTSTIDSKGKTWIVDKAILLADAAIKAEKGSE